MRSNFFVSACLFPVALSYLPMTTSLLRTYCDQYEMVLPSDDDSVSFHASFQWVKYGIICGASIMCRQEGYRDLMPVDYGNNGHCEESASPCERCTHYGEQAEDVTFITKTLVTVFGEPTEDKRIDITVVLNVTSPPQWPSAKSCLCAVITSQLSTREASRLSTREASRGSGVVGKFWLNPPKRRHPQLVNASIAPIGVWLYPTFKDGADGTIVLSASVNMPRYAPSGRWTVDQLIVEGLGPEYPEAKNVSNYMWCEVYNPLEELVSPELSWYTDAQNTLSYSIWDPLSLTTTQEEWHCQAGFRSPNSSEYYVMGIASGIANKTLCTVLKEHNDPAMMLRFINNGRHEVRVYDFAHKATRSPDHATSELCAANQKVESFNCVPCGPGMTISAGSNRPGDYPRGLDTTCNVIYCGENQHVHDHKCIDCQPGKWSWANADSSDGNTECEAILCEEDEFVFNHTCSPCRPGTIHIHGTDASGDETECG